jgi:hypothetical protein
MRRAAIAAAAERRGIELLGPPGALPDEEHAERAGVSIS